MGKNLQVLQKCRGCSLLSARMQSVFMLQNSRPLFRPLVLYSYITNSELSMCVYSTMVLPTVRAVNNSLLSFLNDVKVAIIKNVYIKLQVHDFGRNRIPIMKGTYKSKAFTNTMLFYRVL